MVEVVLLPKVFMRRGIVHGLWEASCRTRNSFSGRASRTIHPASIDEMAAVNRMGCPSYSGCSCFGLCGHRWTVVEVVPERSDAYQFSSQPSSSCHWFVCSSSSLLCGCAPSRSALTRLAVNAAPVQEHSSEGNFVGCQFQASTAKSS